MSYNYGIMQVAVIGVGTELTTGQIINKNSAWISKNLKLYGVDSTCHLVVPDDRKLILDALDFCAARCDTLFVTGGLGPTTDDFTRDLIAEWAGRPLEFDEASWLHVNERLKSRAIKIRESQRQQCFFPKGSQVLPNPEGTANAFYLRVHDKDVFVLPGPPAEIAAIWKSSIEPMIQDRTKNLDKSLTSSWDTMGLGESDISHLTEECLKGLDVEKGYRVHLPYVEVKVTFPASQQALMSPWIQKLDEALRHVTVTRNGEEVPQLLAQKLTTVATLEVVDALSGQGLLNRLSPALKSYMKEKNWSFTSQDSTSKDPQTLKLVLKPWDSTTAIAEIHYRGATHKTSFEAPFMISKNPERKNLYFAERALIFWHQKLSDLI